MLAAACASLLVACSSTEDATPTNAEARTASSATPPVAGTDVASTPVVPASDIELAPFVPPTDPDAAEAFAHIEVLAGDIGIRSAGTPEERRAAEYIRDQLASSGYLVEIEPFEVDVPRDQSSIALPDTSTLRAFAMGGSPDGEVTAALLEAGLGRTEDLEGLDVAGAILLVRRGEIEFGIKAQNAQEAGASALVVYNSDAEPFRGALGDLEVTIPVVAVSGADGSLLLDLAAAGEAVVLTVELIEEPFDSWNVVARPSSAPCTAYLGAHFDSVPAGPGANDNASGTAAVLELARTHRVPGLCVLAFGSEEIGLFGSRAFVNDHDLADARFMLNFDMVSKITRPEFVASPSSASRALADRASAIAATLGLEIPRGAFPSNASSDHASFEDVGVPAITVYSGDDPFIHTPQDEVTNASLEDLDTMLRAGAAVLRELLADER